jgi:phosphoribosylformylglycinamidine cyclo-ligase
MQNIGSVPETEMFRSFNMGLGMVIICDQEDSDTIQAHFGKLSYVIGRVASGNQSVVYI